MNYRSRTDIISSILETANGGNAKKIKMMYQANLSYAQLKKYLMVLTEIDLLLYDLDTHTYTFKTTDKDYRFLQVYNGLDTLIKEERAESEQEQQQQQIPLWY
jgi:predicted transcriptional regulator